MMWTRQCIFCLSFLSEKSNIVCCVRKDENYSLFHTSKLCQNYVRETSELSVFLPSVFAVEHPPYFTPLTLQAMKVVALRSFIAHSVCLMYMSTDIWPHVTRCGVRIYKLKDLGSRMCHTAHRASLILIISALYSGSIQFGTLSFVSCGWKTWFFTLTESVV
jgi:hypothetical protein